MTARMEVLQKSKNLYSIVNKSKSFSNLVDRRRVQYLYAPVFIVFSNFYKKFEITHFVDE